VASRWSVLRAPADGDKQGEASAEPAPPVASTSSSPISDWPFFFSSPVPFLTSSHLLEEGRVAVEIDCDSVGEQMIVMTASESRPEQGLQYSTARDFREDGAETSVRGDSSRCSCLRPCMKRNMLKARAQNRMISRLSSSQYRLRISTSRRQQLYCRWTVPIGDWDFSRGHTRGDTCKAMGAREVLVQKWSARRLLKLGSDKGGILTCTHITTSAPKFPHALYSALSNLVSARVLVG